MGENGSSVSSAEQNWSLCVTMLLETLQLCTPLVVPVFRKSFVNVAALNPDGEGDLLAPAEVNMLSQSMV